MKIKAVVFRFYASVVLTIALISPAHAVELSCPSSWSDSIEILASFTFAFAPPGGTDFFALDPPALQSFQQDSSKTADQVLYDSSGKTLYALFCGLTPELAKDNIVVQLGPERNTFSAAQLSIRKLPSGRRRISVHSAKIITPNWISPTKVIFERLEQADHDRIILNFVAPGGTQIRFKSLKLSLTNDWMTCRAGVMRPRSVRLKIPVHVRVKQDAGSYSTHSATLYPGLHCGEPTTLDISFDSFQHLEPSEHQNITFQISRVMAAPGFKWALLDQWCYENESMCEPLSIDRGKASISAPFWASARIELRESNVHPASFLVMREMR